MINVTLNCFVENDYQCCEGKIQDAMKTKWNLVTVVWGIREANLRGLVLGIWIFILRAVATHHKAGAGHLEKAVGDQTFMLESSCSCTENGLKASQNWCSEEILQ